MTHSIHSKYSKNPTKSFYNFCPFMFINNNHMGSGIHDVLYLVAILDPYPPIVLKFAVTSMVLLLLTYYPFNPDEYKREWWRYLGKYIFLPIPVGDHIYCRPPIYTLFFNHVAKFQWSHQIFTGHALVFLYPFRLQESKTFEQFYYNYLILFMEF